MLTGLPWPPWIGSGLLLFSGATLSRSGTEKEATLSPWRGTAPASGGLPGTESGGSSALTGADSAPLAPGRPGCCSFRGKSTAHGSQLQETDANEDMRGKKN